MTYSKEEIINLDYWNSPVVLNSLQGGLSNQSYVAIENNSKYVVRLGEDYAFHHVFREHETMVSNAAYKAGFSPALRYQKRGLMIFDFIEGKTFQAIDVIRNLESLAKLLRNFHTTMPNFVSGGARLFWVFHVLRDYARLLLKSDSPYKKNVNDYLSLSKELESAQIPQPIVFSHNDMLPANFIQNDEKIWIIDYEYAAYSTPVFDLAGVAANAGFDALQDRELLQLYYKQEPERDLLKSLAAMKVAALLREAMWGMVSDIHLDTPGIDYLSYAEENIKKLETELIAYRGSYG